MRLQNYKLMKWSFFSLFFVVILACSSNVPSDNAAQGAQSFAEDISADPVGPARLDIQISGAPAGQVRMVGFYGDQNYVVDTTTADAAGRFIFQKQTGYPAGFYFIMMQGNISFQMIMNTTEQNFTLRASAPDIINTMKVTGSLDNELLYKNLAFQSRQDPLFNDVSTRLRGAAPGTPQYQTLKAEQDKLVAERKAHIQSFQTQYPDAFFTKFKTAGQNPDPQTILKPNGTLDTLAQLSRYRAELWNNVDFSDNRLLHTPVIVNKLKRYITELTVQHADSINKSAGQLVDKVVNHKEYLRFFANWITLQYDPEKTTLMDPEAVYVFMIQRYFTKERAFWADSSETHSLQLRAYEMAASLVGLKGPDVKAPAPDGSLKSIYDIKAPYIIVYMFDPNCENCAVETPKLVRFYKEWKNKGVEVYGIALNTNDAEWKGYIAKNGLNWINVFDPTNKSIYAKYFVNHTPELYVLDPDRTIIAKNLNVDQVATVIQRDQRKRGR